MKKLLPAALLALAPALPASAADPIRGMWATQPDNGEFAHVEMGPCAEGKTCGWIRQTFTAEGEHPNDTIGEMLVIDMAETGSGRFEGRIKDPTNGRVYLSKIEMDGDRLYLKGCVLGGLICQTQTWTRVE
jgi:uncharacterized protein (DUF2147 family)